MKLDTHEEIREFYDRNLNMTLLDLSCETGLTVPELKKILMEDSSIMNIEVEED
jgi:hypothetical protein|tara:strand:+ start:2006 stop:2167 length:162 start_codon:yes stop_codon:yes gene_type:complete